MFGNILDRLFGSSNDNAAVVGGSDDVFHAILENMDGTKRYIAHLGEPELVDHGGEFATDYMVRIPTWTKGSDPTPPDVECELPNDERGESSDRLFQILDYYDIGAVEDLGDLAGCTVAAEFDGEVLDLKFEELADE